MTCREQVYGEPTEDQVKRFREELVKEGRFTEDEIKNFSEEKNLDSMEASDMKRRILHELTRTDFNMATQFSKNLVAKLFGRSWQTIVKWKSHDNNLHSLKRNIDDMDKISVEEPPPKFIRMFDDPKTFMIKSLLIKNVSNSATEIKIERGDMRVIAHLAYMDSFIESPNTNKIRCICNNLRNCQRKMDSEIGIEQWTETMAEYCKYRNELLENIKTYIDTPKSFANLAQLNVPWYFSDVKQKYFAETNKIKIAFSYLWSELSKRTHKLNLFVQPINGFVSHED